MYYYNIVFIIITDILLNCSRFYLFCTILTQHVLVVSNFLILLSIMRYCFKLYRFNFSGSLLHSFFLSLRHILNMHTCCLDAYSQTNLLFIFYADKRVNSHCNKYFLMNSVEAAREIKKKPHLSIVFRVNKCVIDSSSAVDKQYVGREESKLEFKFAPKKRAQHQYV
jgi:hypothetical protein